MRVMVTVMPFAGHVGPLRHDGQREVADLLERLADGRAPVVRTGEPLWA